MRKERRILIEYKLQPEIAIVPGADTGVAAAATVGTGDSLQAPRHAGAGHRAGWLNAIKLALAITAFGEGTALLLVDVHN